MSKGGPSTDESVSWSHKLNFLFFLYFDVRHNNISDDSAYLDRRRLNEQEIAAVLINFERHPEWLFKEVKIRFENVLSLSSFLSNCLIDV